MLGKLARWLRIIGYDTILADKQKDSELVRLAKSEDRVLLTLDKSVPGVHLPSSDLEDQLVFLAKELGIEIPGEPVPLFCPECNGRLKETKDKLPKYVNKGWICTSCGKVYWEGSHWRRIRGFLSRVRRRL